MRYFGFAHIDVYWKRSSCHSWDIYYHRFKKKKDLLPLTHCSRKEEQEEEEKERSCTLDDLQKPASYVISFLFCFSLPIKVEQQKGKAKKK